MNNNDFGQGPGKVREQPVAALDLLVALAERIEQAVDRANQLRRIRIARYGKAPSNRCVPGRIEHLLVEPGNSARSATVAQPKHGHHDARQNQKS